MKPNFIALSFQIADTAGHKYYNGPELTAAVQYADTLLGELFAGLVERQVMEDINIIVVSDHGMTGIDSSRKTVMSPGATFRMSIRVGRLISASGSRIRPAEAMELFGERIV